MQDQTMTSLRMRVVKAGARALFRSGVDMEANQYPRRHAEAALDAMLDCLTENADEWHDMSWEFPALPSLETRLLEALREDR